MEIPPFKNDEMRISFLLKQSFFSKKVSPINGFNPHTKELKPENSNGLPANFMVTLTKIKEFKPAKMLNFMPYLLNSNLSQTKKNL